MENKVKTQEPRRCECGCGALTSGARFRQGHDAKLKSTLIKAALAGSQRSISKLEKLGWSKFLDTKRAAIARTSGGVGRKRQIKRVEDPGAPEASTEATSVAS